jgi:PLP dependent protein
MIHERVRQNLEEVRARIALAAERTGRPVADVRLVAVTKKSSPLWINAVLDCGVFDLGENYPQELWKKSEILADRAAAIRWHLIGHLQTNKVKKTLPLVKMIHAVDSLKLLALLNEAAQASGDPPSVCLQVNTSGEESKHGWSAETIMEDSDSIAACRSIPIVGLMTMAALEGGTQERARASFALLRATRDALRQATGLPLPELSMGMSGDFEAAILEGATLVRIGSAIFEGLQA